MPGRRRMLSETRRNPRLRYPFKESIDPSTIKKKKKLKVDGYAM